MSFSRQLRLFRPVGVALIVCALAVVSGVAQAAGGGDFGIPKPAEAEPTSGFEALKKPPIPLSFLAHDGGWIDFQYPPSARDRVAPLIAQADDLRAELAEDLGQTPLDGIEIRVARGVEEMSTLAPQGAPPTLQVTSAAYPTLKLIVLSLGQAGAAEPVDLRDGFRRQLAVLALADAVSPRPVPTWFAEGFARHFSHEGEGSREWALYRASIRHGMHATAELDAVLEKGGPEAELGAAEASDFIGFLLKPERRARFATAIERVRQGDALDAALASSYGSGLATLERHWRAERTRWTTLMTVSLAIGVPALVLVGWASLRAVRRRRRQLLADAREGKAKERAGEAAERTRVHIVLSRRDERVEPPVIAEPEIPKVEHEGEWHTLH
jgi:hypothetical protein